MVSFIEHAPLVELRQGLSGGSPAQQSSQRLIILLPLQHGSGQKLYFAQLNGIVSFGLRSWLEMLVPFSWRQSARLSHGSSKCFNSGTPYNNSQEYGRIWCTSAQAVLILGKRFQPEWGRYRGICWKKSSYYWLRVLLVGWTNTYNNWQSHSIETYP